MENLQEKKEVTLTDAIIIAEWKSMLDLFHSLTESKPEVSKVQSALESLAEKAKLSNILTPRQKEGIADRCRNYINGTYGKNLAHLTH